MKDENYLKELGEKVREHRLRLYETPRSRRMLSRDSGVTDATILNIERGKVNPSILILERLAYAFGIHVSELLPS